MPTIHELQDDSGAEFMRFGPDEPGRRAVELAATFANPPAEYAAIRSRVGILHLPQRGILRLTGGDRLEFLQRLVTQDLATLAPRQTRRTFQLNGKGRIVADTIVHHGESETWLELDVFDVEPLQQLLESRLFAEDVTIEDTTEQWQVLALHGPASAALLARVSDNGEPALPEQGEHETVGLADSTCTAYRWDDAGATSVRLLVPSERAAAVYQALLDAAGFDPAADASPDADYAEARRQGLRGRPIGWLAYNTARIEAGTPLFHIDFGPDSLPAETGVLDDAVSFTKGCYLGQEIVARMKNLGHPRRMLVGLRFESEKVPAGGAQVHAPAAPGERPDSGAVVGAVTSSTISPLLDHTAIAFAVMKWGFHEPGTRVRVLAEDEMVEATVGPLRFID